MCFGQRARVALSRADADKDASLPLSGGPAQAGTTSQVAFRALIEKNGEAKLAVALRTA